MVGLPLMALVVSLQQPDTSAQVTFRSAAAPMGRLLQSLSEATKIPFEAARAIAPDVMVIDVKDVKIQDLMDRIALADTAEWRFENGKFLLSPAKGKRTVEARLEAQHRAEEFRSQVEKRLHPKTPAVAPKPGEFPDLDALPENADQTAIFKLLAQVRPVDIGTMGSDDRIVFATNPTSMQRPLGSGTNEIIQAWVQRHNKEVAGMKGDPEAAVAPMFQGETPALIKDMIADQTKPISTAIAKTMLVVEKGGLMMGATTVELRVYDASGKVLKRGQSFLGMGQLTSMIRAIQKKTPETPNTNTPIEFSEDSKALDKASAALMTGTLSLDFPGPLKEKMMRPDLFDPLGFHATDTLLSYAKWKKKPLVAVIPDTMATSIMGGGKAKTLEEFERGLSEPGDLKVDANDTWLVLTPQTPVLTRDSRVNRVALTRLVKAGANPSGVRLDDLAAYALVSPPPMENPAAMPYITAFAPGAISNSMGGGASWSMLRFYGSLSEGQQQACRSGRTIPFAGMDSRQIGLIARMAFGPNPHLSVDRPGAPAKHDDDPLAFVTTMMIGSKDYREEPTEVLPTGVPGGGAISVEVSDDNFVRPSKTTGGAISYALGADELAMFKMFRESPAFSSMAGSFQLPAEGKLGQRTVLKFTFHLAQSITMAQTLHDDYLPADAQTVQLDALPDAFGKRVAQRLEALKKGPLGLAGAFMGAKPKATP